MVTKIKISNESEDEKIIKVFNDFLNEHVMILDYLILTKDSDCKNFEYIYFFENQDICNSFIRILLDNKIVIYEVKDVTDDVCEIINSNKLEEFKNELCQSSKDNFDEIISRFTFEHITKDMVLDKINALGIKALTEQDYSILKS
jgi:hypothetical protein